MNSLLNSLAKEREKRQRSRSQQLPSIESSAHSIQSRTFSPLAFPQSPPKSKAELDEKEGLHAGNSSSKRRKTEKNLHPPSFPAPSFPPTPEKKSEEASLALARQLQLEDEKENQRHACASLQIEAGQQAASIALASQLQQQDAHWSTSTSSSTLPRTPWPKEAEYTEVQHDIGQCGL